MIEKVLLVSHGLTCVTGFGNQIWLIARALADAGYEVMAAHREYRGEPITFAEGTTTISGRDLSNITMLPFAVAPWGDEIVPYYIKKYRPDVVLTLGDIWCYQYLAKVPKDYPWYWLAHYVFDTENIVSLWRQSLDNADYVILPAKFSYEMVKRYGYEHIHYIPHGIDTKTFKPEKRDDIQTRREEEGIPPDAFTILSVAHNQERKRMDRLLRAFTLFAKDKNDATLFLHCKQNDQTGWDMGKIIPDLGITNKVYFTDMSAKMVEDVHVPQTMMAELYNLADIHALSTAGEGFGIPVIESMACGLPNVMTQYTTANEFLQVNGRNEHGIPVPYSDIFFHNTGGAWASIDIMKMAEAFQYLYENPGQRHAMGTKARKFVVKNYDIERVKKEWARLFEDVEERIGRKQSGVKRPIRGLKIGRR